MQHRALLLEPSRRAHGKPHVARRIDQERQRARRLRGGRLRVDADPPEVGACGRERRLRGSPPFSGRELRVGGGGAEQPRQIRAAEPVDGHSEVPLRGPADRLLRGGVGRRQRALRQLGQLRGSGLVHLGDQLVPAREAEPRHRLGDRLIARQSERRHRLRCLRLGLRDGRALLRAGLVGEQPVEVALSSLGARIPGRGEGERRARPLERIGLGGRLPGDLQRRQGAVQQPEG